MKILFVTTAFNGMAQRLWIELDRLNHQVLVHIAGGAEAMVRAVEDARPDLIIAPFLKVKIPREVYERYVCMIVHPGIVGDRGASSLDWAILRDEKEWGVSILQAVEKMDAGPVWAFHAFDMRKVSKAALYRCEVTQAAAKGVLEAVERFQAGASATPPTEYPAKIKGHWNRKLQAVDFSFSPQEKLEDILTKIRAADSDPGAPTSFFGQEYLCFGVHEEGLLSGNPGTLPAQRDGAICLAVSNGSLWITHLKKREEGAIKLPAVLALGDQADNIPMSNADPFEQIAYPTLREIRVETEGEIAWVYFDFYNGAMSVSQCRRLSAVLKKLKQQKELRLIVLMGGEDLWSNGIHLNVIEQAENPADESWANIQAIDDLIYEIITATDHYVISALRGNAGAGGVPLALAADKVLARDGVVLNPHTKNMGLYGSEYWTYLLPKRIGIKKAVRFTEDCLPWGVAIAKEIGLIDDYHGKTVEEFETFVKEQARRIAGLSYFDKLIKAKKFQRMKDERYKPLEQYRKEELERMWKNFYENDQDYDYKRYCFVHKIPLSAESRDLYSSRRKIYRRRKWESIEYPD